MNFHLFIMLSAVFIWHDFAHGGNSNKKPKCRDEGKNFGCYDTESKCKVWNLTLRDDLTCDNGVCYESKIDCGMINNGAQCQNKTDAKDCIKDKRDVPAKNCMEADKVCCLPKPTCDGNNLMCTTEKACGKLNNFELDKNLTCNNGLACCKPTRNCSQVEAAAKCIKACFKPSKYMGMAKDCGAEETCCKLQGYTCVPPTHFCVDNSKECGSVDVYKVDGNTTKALADNKDLTCPPGKHCCAAPLSCSDMTGGNCQDNIATCKKAAVLLNNDCSESQHCCEI